MRHLGVSVYAALVVGAVLSLVPGVLVAARGNRPSGLEAFFTVLLFASFAISLVPGDERFLLAKDALVTSGVGLWFLASLRWADRPLAYQFAKPMAEGRFGWPGDWERLWDREPWFRRMWRTASLLWAVGTLLDAAARVVMAYTLPADLVPGLNLAMYAVTLRAERRDDGGLRPCRRPGTPATCDGSRLGLEDHLDDALLRGHLLLEVLVRVGRLGERVVEGVLYPAVVAARREWACGPDPGAGQDHPFAGDVCRVASFAGQAGNDRRMLVAATRGLPPCTSSSRAPSPASS